MFVRFVKQLIARGAAFSVLVVFYFLFFVKLIFFTAVAVGETICCGDYISPSLIAHSI